jgi:hypothetical protein
MNVLKTSSAIFQTLLRLFPYPPSISTRFLGGRRVDPRILPAPNRLEPCFRHLLGKVFLGALEMDAV